ncbi:unnamed protein product [Fasciola hepatica]|uniref:Uncharacterized protein n=1 Tax=Fasciola hepatica TaxID=6192 RepID=A0ABC9HID5_FASHE
MLDVEVVPEMAIRHKNWEFLLGMPIQQMIEILRKQDCIIKSVDFWYNHKSPFTSNLAVVLPVDGLRFHFDPLLQRLRLIEIYDLSRVTLRYWAQYFNSPSVTPTLQEVLRIFGSTKPLLPVESDGSYRLSYRGITFFMTPTSFGSGSHDHTSSVAPIGSLNPSEQTLVVTRLFIYSGNNLSEAKITLDLPSACYLNNVFLERLEVLRHINATSALRFHLVSQDLSVNPTREPQTRRFTRTLQFGATVQDVLAALGSPSRIFYKTEDKMQIHMPKWYRIDQPRRSDYFFNYFTLGVDILVDGQTHQVIKFVLHTNQPGEYTFNTYYRCFFEIPLLSSAPGVEKIVEEGAHGDLAEDLPRDSPLMDAGADTGFVVTPFVKWSTIQHHNEALLTVEPVVIHRSVKAGTNIFGSTLAYGYQDIIFEVIPNCDYLASVTLYAPARRTHS